MGEALALHRSLFNQVLRGFDIGDYSFFAHKVQVQVRYKHMINQRLLGCLCSSLFAYLPSDICAKPQLPSTTDHSQ